MRVSIGLVCQLALFIAASSLQAATTEFPYEAVVETDDLVVRSGPGERYDPTLKINTGQQVTVHRHDPGGWYMISPPPGSFSWIDAAYVQRTGSETGAVKVPARSDGLPPRVVVWIGSQFTDGHKYFGRQLADGDEVRILGEKPGKSDRGPTTFYKIAPPRLEYRWVKGDFIVPLSDANRIARIRPAAPVTSVNTQPHDPFAAPSGQAGSLSAPGFPPESAPTLLERDLTRGINAGQSQTQQSSADIAAQRSDLYELDGQLKAMVSQTPNHWDLEGMEQSYLRLQETANALVTAQIESRLAAIESRKKIKAEYDSFVSVITQTEQRDAALLSMQRSIASGLPAAASQVELGPATAFPQQLTGVMPQPTPAPSTPALPAPTSAQPSAVPQMHGAGIVQRTASGQPGVPRYALVAPDGRHLAYLHPGEGVRLDGYLNRSMGVVGQRTFDARLQSDVIVVERLSPVQLQP